MTTTPYAFLNEVVPLCSLYSLLGDRSLNTSQGGTVVLIGGMLFNIVTLGGGKVLCYIKNAGG